MAALKVEYEGESYTLDLEDMDTDEARAMERYGVPNLKALEDGVSVGDVSALTVMYWLMLRQSGEGDVRLDRVKIKPVKFIHALAAASAVEAVDGGKA
jgi:hypothetical protein